MDMQIDLCTLFIHAYGLFHAKFFLLFKSSLNILHFVEHQGSEIFIGISFMNKSS